MSLNLRLVASRRGICRLLPDSPLGFRRAFDGAGVWRRNGWRSVDSVPKMRARFFYRFGNPAILVATYADRVRRPEALRSPPFDGFGLTWATMDKGPRGAEGVQCNFAD